MRWFPLSVTATLVLLATLAVGVGLAFLPQHLVLPAAILIAPAVVPLRRRWVGTFLMLAGLALVPMGPAHAATGILDSVRPALIDVATLLILAAASWAAQRFSALTGIQIEARHREALQSALANAAGIAVNAGIDMALGYVRRSVPDALAHFRVDSDSRIIELLEPHMMRLKAGS